MPKVTFWRMVSAIAETTDAPDDGVCQSLDSVGWSCPFPAEWVLTWSVNESGLPGSAARGVDFVCGQHLVSRLRIRNMHPFLTPAVTVTRYEESV